MRARLVPALLASAGILSSGTSLSARETARYEVVSPNDSPSHYLREPDVMEFLGPVPSVWDRTIGLDARVGDYALVARRSGEEWYVAAMTDFDPRDLEVDLGFLPEGEYRMEIWRDGPNADRYASDFARETRDASRHDRLRIELAPGGGWVARLRPERPREAEPQSDVAAGGPPTLESTLEIVNVSSGKRRTVLRVEDHIEAPNWSRDGNTLIYNSGGRLYVIPVTGGRPTLLDTGFATRCNNDHGLSPDGKWLAISHSPADHSLIYVVSAEGGTPRLVTEKGPSYWHGWSPDGETLAYCAERGGNYDVYVIPAEGGEEIRLTDAPGLDDGPDYSPDGRHIYFNSERTGLMKIWRMNADGSAQEQVTFDEDWADWFPHPSPDGRHLVFLSYDKSVEGHPPNQDVVLRIRPLSGGEPRILVELFGGQGTINVPSWSPDGKELAFVSYRLLR